MLVMILIGLLVALGGLFYMLKVENEKVNNQKVNDPLSGLKGMPKVLRELEEDLDSAHKKLSK